MSIVVFLIDVFHYIPPLSSGPEVSLDNSAGSLKDAPPRVVSFDCAASAYATSSCVGCLSVPLLL